MVRTHIRLTTILDVVLAGILAVWPSVRSSAQSFTDPAPPTVQGVPDMPAPDAKPQEGLKFHAAPKPLAPGAVTHDWRSYLGPSHNGIATETPILKEFGKSGPPVVWEVPKGEGFASPAV